MAQYIYLIQEREFIKTNEPIYKIGKTKQALLERIKKYPKGSNIIISMLCDDCDTAEKFLIDKFKKKYKFRRDYGYEYFEGNPNDMCTDIHNYCNNKNIDDYFLNLKNFLEVKLFEMDLSDIIIAINEFDIDYDLEKYENVENLKGFLEEKFDELDLTEIIDAICEYKRTIYKYIDTFEEYEKAGTSITNVEIYKASSYVIGNSFPFYEVSGCVTLFNYEIGIGEEKEEFQNFNQLENRLRWYGVGQQTNDDTDRFVFEDDDGKVFEYDFDKIAAEIVQSHLNKIYNLSST